MDLKVKIKEVDEINRELSVEVPAEHFGKHLEKELAEIQKKVTIKGFRKGKAPLNIIRSNYAEQARADVVDRLIKESYSSAVSQNSLRVASSPTLTDMNLEDDGRLKYTLKVEVFPEIKEVNYDGLEILDEEIEVSDDEVNATLEMVRKQHSELKKVDRAATDSDVVVVNLKKLLDPRLLLEGDNFPKSVIDLANKATVPEFREHLPGMKAGESKEIETSYPDDYPNKKFAGARIKYLAEIVEVNDRILPEVDDSLAKKAGLGETLLEMRLKIREDIDRSKKQALARHYKSEIIAQICEKNPIPIPEGIVNQYLDKAVAEFKQNQPDADEQKIRDQYRQVGVNSIRWNMLFSYLARQEKIEVSPADTEKLIERFAKNYKLTVEQAKESLQKSGQAADLKESILEDKVLDFLMARSRKVKAKKK